MPGPRIRPGLRPGIRGKLLASSGVAITLIVLLELGAQYAAQASVRHFEVQLERYHMVHRMRVALGEFRILAERHFRSPVGAELEYLFESIGNLSAMEATLESLTPTVSRDEMFEIRATGFAMSAYRDRISEAIRMRGAGDPGNYSAYLRADLVAGFMDSYLERLLTLMMRSGEDRFREGLRRSRLWQNLALAGIIAAGLAALLVTSLVATSITAPIRTLAKASERLAAGDLDVEPVHARSDDEVGVLSRSFALMSANIRALVEGLREKAQLEARLHEEEIDLARLGRALREAQFMHLQDQIRPHFLFNALNSIAMSAMLERAPTTERLSQGLARLLRYTLAEGGPDASLREELDVVREYLAFQRERFGERLSWSVRDRLEGAAPAIPRLSIQPLVENAVRHGIEPSERGGRVMVGARVRRGMLDVSIIDTGSGMDATTLAALRASIAAAFAGRESEANGTGNGTGSGRRGLGLSNVAMRLYFRYGDQASLQLHSIPGRGTLVRMVVPILPPGQAEA